MVPARVLAVSHRLNRPGFLKEASHLRNRSHGEPEKDICQLLHKGARTCCTHGLWQRQRKIVPRSQPPLNPSPPTSEERAQIKELEREIRKLRQANGILRKASAYFARGESSAVGSRHDCIDFYQPNQTTVD